MDEDYKFLGERLNGVEQALVWHRDTTNRAIGFLNQEVVEYRNRLDREDMVREERQRQFDEKVGAIQQSMATAVEKITKQLDATQAARQAQLDTALSDIQRIVRRVVIVAVIVAGAGLIAAAFLIGRSL